MPVEQYDDDGQAAPRPLCVAVSVQVDQTQSLVQSDQVPAQSMSGGQSPSPAGHDGADAQGAPLPLWATASVQVVQTQSLLQSDQVPAQSVPQKPVSSSLTTRLSAQQAHSSIPAKSAAPCPSKLFGQFGTRFGWP